MRTAYLDTIAGIAGDMTMAAFVSAGLPFDELTQELKKLSVGGFDLVANHITRSGIVALHIDVVTKEEQHHHRQLHSIEKIISESAFSPFVKQKAGAIFRVIAEAEAKVHNMSVEKVHFHEVGALDSLVDIVGTAICLEKLNIQKVYTSPVRLGKGGFIQTQHGTMPTPAPATVEILKDYPVVLTSLPHELTTPTGAGIVKALSSGLLNDEVMRIEAVGYGTGERDFPEIPNLLRVIVGELEQPLDHDDVVVVETNIDDMNPQVYPYLIEKLLASGAHDAYLVPVIMKKGRPGVLLSVMAGRSRLDGIISLLYRETSTIGVRIQRVDRRKLPRREIVVHTSLGPVRAKSVERDGREIIAPEYEECKRIATEKRLPLLQVMHVIEQEIEEQQRR